MPRSIWTIVAASAVLGSTCLGAEPASTEAAPVTPSPNYSGDFWTRPALTGDWGGTRNELAKKGLTLDIYSTQVYQGTVHGGLDKGWNYGGRENVTLNLDTQKMGLWPGGFIMLEGEGNYGEFAGPRQTGALLPADLNSFLPETDGPQFDLIAVTFTQFISHNLGFIVGKLDTFSGDANLFAHGKGDHQFMNMSLSINPIMAVTVPYSTLGAGMIILPTENPEECVITLSVIDAEGRPDTAGFDTAFKGGTTFAAEGRFTTHFMGLTGHQLVGGTYSDRLFTDLNQRVANIIIPGLPVQHASGSWAGYYNFDQYLFQPDPKVDRGLGVFGRFGISDGIANPIHYFGSFGISGKGLIPGRENDQFGIGFFRICAANAQLLNTLNFHESEGMEAYYEIAITPSIFLTPDIQILKPSQQGVDTSCVLGVRLTMKF